MPLLPQPHPRHLVALGSAAVLIAGLAVGSAGTSQAATPTGGTLSPSTPSLRYTAGPFAVPNVSGTTGTLQGWFTRTIWTGLEASLKGKPAPDLGVRSIVLVQ